MEHKSQKRHKALQSLSREHHQGLLLSWKIRAGLNKNIDAKRIWHYANWFFETHLIPHFDMEETHVFPILDDGNKLKKKAMAEHRRLKRLFSDTNTQATTLGKIEEELEQHIRFEERVLFPEIQKIASQEQLALIEDIHKQDDFIENLDDQFWN